MKTGPKITKVSVTTFEYELENVGKDYNTFNMVYEGGSKLKQSGTILQIHTDQGIVGEYPEIGRAIGDVQTVAEYLIGKDALSRESIYNDMKRGLRHGAMLGVGVVDICLWDIAGSFTMNLCIVFSVVRESPFLRMRQRCMAMRMVVCRHLKILQISRSNVMKWATGHLRFTDGVWLGTI